MTKTRPFLPLIALAASSFTFAHADDTGSQPEPIHATSSWTISNANYISLQPSEFTEMRSAPGNSFAKQVIGAKTLQGKVKPSARRFIVLFSASWCPPCRVEAPKIVQLYNKSIAKDKNVELILASCGDTEVAAKQWAQKEKMPYPILMPSEWERIPALAKINPPAIPTAFLLDEKGKVIAKGQPASLYSKTK